MRRVGGVLGTVVGVALLLAAVAAASRPEGPAGVPALGEAPIRVVVDAVSILLLLTAALGLGLAVWALWPRQEEEPPALPPRRRGSVAAMALSAALFVVLAVWLRERGLVRLPALAPAPPDGPGGGPQTTAPIPVPGLAGLGLDGIALVVAAAIALAAGFVAWRALRPRRPRGGRAALAGLRAVLDDAIEDVLAEADARRAVIAAWARLERVLARHGLPRQEAEAPSEYAARAHAELAVGSVSLERLADLFEWARFSLNEVTPAMREEALAGLRAVRDGLRHAA